MAAKMKKRCVIVGGADINNHPFLREQLCADDYVVFCDSGLKHLEQLQATPGLIVGDFDSHENPHLDVETIVVDVRTADDYTAFHFLHIISGLFFSSC